MHRWLLLFLVMWLVACGGKGASSGGEKKVDLDADPLALLPDAAIFVANVDARSMFASVSVGSEISALTDKLVPLDEDTGFQASRDVDRVVAAGYGTGADVAAVVVGRFDEDKIKAAKAGKSGAALTKSTYAGRDTFSVGGVDYSVLTPKTVVAGTPDGLRRLLERLQKGPPQRAIPPWMVDTLQTPGAEVAIATDFSTQPIVSASFGSLNLPWIKGMRTARVLGNFEKPGMNVAATLSYSDEAEAKTAADGARLVNGWFKVLGPLLGGVSLRDFEVSTDASDVRCKVSVDEQSLHDLLALAPRFLPSPR